MVSPNPHGFGCGEQTAGVIDSFACLDDVAQHDNLIDLLSVKTVQSGLQILDLFVNVGDDAKSHESGSEAEKMARLRVRMLTNWAAGLRAGPRTTRGFPA